MIDLIARGRIVPSRSSEGSDTWRIGPLDVEDSERRRALADALSPGAHARVTAVEPSVEVWHPAAAVEAFFVGALLAAKRSPADAVVGSGEGWITELTNGDLAALVELGRSD